MTNEQWIGMLEHPGYAVSNWGNVMNMRTDLIKSPSCNQQGILMVNMSIYGKQCIRSVAVLVAEHFLSRASVPDYFDTPIHLDGDKTNCHVDNLMWRPRWFAVKYHRQFYPEERARRYGVPGPVEIIETGERFPSSWDAAIKYGLLDFEIFLAIQNNTYVFPINQLFRECEE